MRGAYFIFTNIDGKEEIIGATVTYRGFSRGLVPRYTRILSEYGVLPKEAINIAKELYQYKKSGEFWVKDVTMDKLIDYVSDILPALKDGASR